MQMSPWKLFCTQGRCRDINDMISGRCADENQAEHLQYTPGTYTHTKHLHTHQALTHTPGTYTHTKQPKRKARNGKDATCGEDEQLEFPLELVDASVNTASLKNGLPNPSETPYTPTWVAYPREMSTCVHQKTCVKRLTAVLLLIANS